MTPLHIVQIKPKAGTQSPQLSMAYLLAVLLESGDSVGLARHKCIFVPFRSQQSLPVKPTKPNRYTRTECRKRHHTLDQNTDSAIRHHTRFLKIAI